MSLISSRTPERNPFSAPAAVEIRGWIMRTDGRTLFLWWCDLCLTWHSNNWSVGGEDGLRCAPRCQGLKLGQVHLVPFGDALPDIIECIENDRQPPGERDPGPIVTPEMARARVRRELAAIAKAAGGGDDELLDRTLRRLKNEVMVIEEWRELYRRMLGGCRRARVMAAVDARYRQRGTIGGRL